MSTKLYLEYQSHHSNQFGHRFGSSHAPEMNYLLANSYSKDFYFILLFLRQEAKKPLPKRIKSQGKCAHL